MSARRDWAVIMARGASDRMGRPKGLTSLPGEDDSFLESIASFYRGLDLPVAVVTTDDLAGQYRRGLPDLAPDRWILRPAGDGTAKTVMAALADLADEATHLWLHPVDLPRVTPRVAGDLRACSDEHPGAVIVPEHRKQPGHPVILPTRPFAFLVGWPVPSGRMRPWLLELTAPGAKQIAPMVALPVDDPGVVTDYDDEESLK